MSLKNFHILFIIVSIVFSAGFGLWCLLTEDGASQAGAPVMGAISLAAAAGLMVYVLKIPSMLRTKEAH